ncbi:MAG: peptidoglycan DD-metalloendopeptidase family protein [Prevotellaceae bacterium]|nr:peptidoglycan DD-metalloendopeptidase family protein [Prevotellaceae bacterium]
MAEKHIFIRLPFIILLLALRAAALAAQTPIQNLEQQKKQIEADIAYTNSLITQTQSEQKASLDNLSLIQANLVARQEYIGEIDKQLVSLSTEITNRQKKVVTLYDELTLLKENYAKMLNFAYRNRLPYMQLMYILGSDDLNQAYRRITYLKAYSEHRVSQAKSIARQSEELKSELSALKVQKSEQQLLFNQKTVELLALDVEEKDYRSTIYALQAKEKELMQDLERKKRQAVLLNAQIQNAIAEETRREAERRREIERKNKEMAAKVAADEHTLTLNFEKQRGSLPAPVARSVVVTRFGVYDHPVLTGIKVTSNGIDLSTTDGAVVSVVADGVVRRIFTTGSTISLLVQHGLYYTVYTHLKGISVRVGDTVRAGQPVGMVAPAPDSKRAILHFELWKQTAKHNPEEWLSKKT